MSKRKPKVKSIPNELFFRSLKEQIDEGQNVMIGVTGRSMSPTFIHKKDKVVVSPFNPDDLKEGDAVLFDRGDTICLHRIIRRNGSKLTIRGDGNSRKALEYATVDKVLAVVTSGTMFGGRPFKTSDRIWIRQAEMVRKYFPVMAVWHGILRILRTYPFSILAFAVLMFLSFYNFKPSQAPEIPDFDKLVHFIMYFGLSTVWWVEWLLVHKLRRKNTWKGSVVCMLCPVIIGGLTELCQGWFTASRQADWIDFLCNAGGVLAATAIALGVIYPIIQTVRINRKPYKI